MDSRLQLAIANDDVAELHRLLVVERNLLDHASEDPFPNTPLHVAAAAGKTHVAMEIAILKPLFTWKLNPEGYSPMHLALQHEHYQTARALMTFDPELIRVRGQGGITPLHYVAGKEGDNELELLAEFLFTCSSSIEDLTSQCETGVHVAVKNHNLKAFKVLFGWLKRVDLTEILNQKDENGNTVLHIAAFEEQPEIIKLLIGHTSINAKNFQGKTALEIFQENPSGDQDVANRLRRQGHRARHRTPALSLSQYFSMELTVLEKYARSFGIRDESLRNIILLMSILIVTITCQVALTQPGGYGKDSSSNPPTNSTVVIANSSDIAIGKPHQVRSPILNAWHLYNHMVVNIVAFCFSTGIIWATSITMWPDSLMVYWSLGILTEVYLICLAIGFPETFKLEERLVSAFYVILLTAALYLPAHMWSKHIRVLGRIDATRRPAGNFLQLKDQKIRKY